MTVDELIEWLESAKRESPTRDVGNYDAAKDVYVDHASGYVVIS